MTHKASDFDSVTPVEEPFDQQGVAAGVSIVAACMLLILAVVSILRGISALVDDEFYVVGAEYVYQFDITTWGWIHLGLGIIAAICALGLMFGTTWGRYAALAVAALVIIANFMSLPYYPAWSFVVIALSVVVIWAVMTWQPER